MAQIYAAFIAVTGPTFVPATPVNGGFSVTIPKGFAGQTYAVLTSCNETVSDDTVAAGPAIIEVCGHTVCCPFPILACLPFPDLVLILSSWGY